MTQNLFKNVSAAQIETAIGKALTELIGHDAEKTMQVKVSTLDFEAGYTSQDTRVALKVQVTQVFKEEHVGVFS